jgi:hypothetical protein
VNDRSLRLDPELVEALHEDEVRQGHPLSEQVAEAFAKGFCEQRELHHQLPRTLLKLHDAANDSDELDGAGIEAWLTWEDEAMLYGVDAEIRRADLEKLIERSTVAIPRAEHRQLHVSDFVRWGRRGGLATLRRYGTSWFTMLALYRWGRVSDADLEAARPVRG